MTRILIVEDRPTQAEQLVYILETEGLEAVVARDGEEGCDLFKRSSFDLVISDIVMPGMTGYDLCRAIKADPKGRDVPVVLLSTLNEPMDIIGGLECGADNFLTKPYQAAHLIQRVRSILENKKLRAQTGLTFGVEISFLGKKFTIDSEKEQILDLLVSTFEDMVRANYELKRTQAELTGAKAKIEEYAIRLEDRVKVTQEKYRLLMEHANDGIFILDAQGDIVEANSVAEQLLGRQRTELVGHRFETLLDRSSAESTSADPKLEKFPAETIRHLHLVDASGKHLSLEVSASSVDIGDTPLTLLIARDVTQRNLLERQLHQSQKMEAIGNLTGGMAHDFNNLLSVIIGNLDLLRELRTDDEEADELAREALDASMRGADLTRRLLAFARNQPLQPEKVDLNKRVSSIVKLLRRVLGENIEISLSLADDIWPIVVDPAQLEAALTNLATNARDAMPRGGQLTIGTCNQELDEDAVVSIANMTPGSYAVIEVTDTGTGMTQDVANRIFEPFFTTKGQDRGTGLGLSMVYGFMKQSGGHINVYSEPGIGTTFRLYLPRTGGKAAADETPGSAEMPLGRGEAILVVEDNAGLRRIVTRQLHELGYHVLETDNAEDAMASLAREPVDLLFTDIILSGDQNGFDLARRARDLCPQLRVVLTSGFPGRSHESIGASERLLIKPYRKADLACALRDGLQG